MQQPGPQQRAAVHQAEVIEHGIRLGADWFALSGDQFTATHVDRGDALLGEQVLDQPLGEGGVNPQVGAPLKIVGQQAASQAAARLYKRFQLQVGRLALRNRLSPMVLCTHCISGGLGVFPDIFIPQHIWKDVSDPTTFKNYDPAKGLPLGTGPYVLGKVTTNETIMVRNDNWWGAKSEIGRAHV